MLRVFFLSLLVICISSSSQSVFGQNKSKVIRTQHASTNLFKSSQTKKYKNGAVAFDGRNYFYNTGDMAFNGQKVYYSNGALAFNGTTVFHPDGKVVGSISRLKNYKIQEDGITFYLQTGRKPMVQFQR